VQDKWVKDQDIMTTRKLRERPQPRQQQGQQHKQQDLAQRGYEIYESQIRSRVEAEHQGKIVAIDINTGAFAIAEDSLTAAKQLLKGYPKAQIFGIRIGQGSVHQLGAHASNISKLNQSWKQEVLMTSYQN
jgi:hypothetical protein